MNWHTETRRTAAKSIRTGTRYQVTGESAPNAPIELHTGQACIVRKGEWHRVHVLEKTQLIHITPAPNGDHRPL